MLVVWSLPSASPAQVVIAVELFKIYFKLSQLRLCKNVINAVESPRFPKLTTFPKSHSVACVPMSRRDVPVWFLTSRFVHESRS